MSGSAGSFIPALRRAVPRVVGAVLGVALVRTGGGVLFPLGVFVLGFSVMTRPGKWWHYVRTGAYPERPVAAEFNEPGAYSVEVQGLGGRPIEVIKALREVTGVGLADAKAKVEAVPVTIAEGRSARSAGRLRDRMERAGATATVVMRTDR